jgi:Protein of unknown function (DUF3096)
MEILVLQPIVALIAGILILIVPHLLNYIVAVNLILIGLVGLLGSPRECGSQCRDLIRSSRLHRSGCLPLLCMPSSARARSGPGAAICIRPR